MSTAVAVTPEQPSYLEKLLNGDLSLLSPEERTAYYLERCKSIGVDPASQPFLFMKTRARDGEDSKTILYVTRSATDQIGKRDGLTETIVSKEISAGTAIVVARVTDGKRSVDNIGVAVFKYDSQVGDALKRAVTQAYRRAIIQFAGVGAVSEEDIEDIAGAEKLGMLGVDPTTAPRTQARQPARNQARNPEESYRPAPSTPEPLPWVTLTQTNTETGEIATAATPPNDDALPAVASMYSKLDGLNGELAAYHAQVPIPTGLTRGAARQLRDDMQAALTEAKALDVSPI